MKFSVVLINPGPVSKQEHKRQWVGDVSLYPPLSLLYLSSILKNNGYKVEVIDQAAERLYLDGILKWIKQRDPDIVGFSIIPSPFYSNTPWIISREIKKWNPNLKIVFGNRHATYNDWRILQAYPSVDVCVRGEAEYTFLELVDAFSKGQSLKNVKGVTYREDGKIQRNPDRELLKNLDELPFPDRTLLKYDYQPSLGGISLFPSGFTTIVGSRGCPFNCRFCCEANYHGFRKRSLENILEEVELLENQGFKFMTFTDDHFTMNKKRVLKFCTLLKKNRIDMDWGCEGRVDQVSLDMLRAMSASNCRILFYGIESASQRILDYYRKGITPHQSILAVNKARKAKIPFIMGSFVLGAPDETLSEIQNTLRFVDRLDLDYPFISILTICPGSDIWSELVAEGRLNEEKYWETGVTAFELGQTIDIETVIPLITESIKGFFLNPRRILKTIFRFLTDPYKLHNFLRVLFSNLRNLSNLPSPRSFNIYTEGKEAELEKKETN